VGERDADGGVERDELQLGLECAALQGLGEAPHGGSDYELIGEERIK
jgi:hypothetical protein